MTTGAGWRGRNGLDVPYTATAVGGRQGRIRSSRRVLDHVLAHPEELGGPGDEATSPEQLFAAGRAARFENALRRAARERKAPVRESSVTADLGIGRGEDGSFQLRAALDASVPGRARAEAEGIARIAHEEVCPDPRATRGDMDVTIRIGS